MILFIGMGLLLTLMVYWFLTETHHTFSFESIQRTTYDWPSSILDGLMFFAAKDEGGEKTEKASRKKIEDSKKKGQVPKSNDVNNFVTLLGAFTFLLLLGPRFIESAKDKMRWYVATMDEIDKVRLPHELYLEGVSYVLNFVLLLFVPMMLVGVISNIAQTGFIFTGEPLKPKLSKLNPIEGFKEMFSQRKAFELAKNLMKLIFVVLISWQFVLGQQEKLLSLSYMHITDALILVGQFIKGLVIRLLILIGVLSVIDYAFQRYKFMKDLRMSKQEQKDEYKQMEGDPQIKAMRRQKQRQIIMNQMMRAVPEATVIITNPTHYSVALRYVMDKDRAPVVLAKGVDAKAFRIREIANEHQIPIIENVPLARTLYSTVEINQEIPYELYEAVGKVLVLVYEMEQKKNYR